jgi:hypothetical protein
MPTRRLGTEIDCSASQFQTIGEESFATGYNAMNSALLGPLRRVPKGMKIWITSC